MSAVASSVVRVQSAMSPAPTRTGSAPGAVSKVQVWLVVVLAPSETVTNHSYRWPDPRFGHVVVAVEPDVTADSVAIVANAPLLYGRPLNVMERGAPSGSVAVTDRSGEVDWPVPAS